MYRYSPPKSNMWGHLLRKMAPARQRELFDNFLKQAVAEYSFGIGSLSLLVGSPLAVLPLEKQSPWGQVTSHDVQRFEELLGMSAREGAFYSLTQPQLDLALTELIQHSTLLPGSILAQSVMITKWLIAGEPMATQSNVMLHYGMKPCISTFFQFETMGQFEFIKQVLSDLDFCQLNEKHLKPVKQRRQKKSGGEANN